MPRAENFSYLVSACETLCADFLDGADANAAAHPGSSLPLLPAKRSGCSLMQ
jgi:hypothetical protein